MQVMLVVTSPSGAEVTLIHDICAKYVVDSMLALVKGITFIKKKKFRTREIWIFR